MKSLRILWADGQQDVQLPLETILPSPSHEINHVRDGASAIEKLNSSSFDILILDLKKPPAEWGGIWLLREIRRLNLHIPTLVISEDGIQSETVTALREGACAYVTKDRAETELSQRISDVLEKHGLPARLRKLISGGASPRLECKETLRWNSHTNKVDKNIEYAVAKTLAAFMNTEGGTLVIGVKDSGEVVGLWQDKFLDRDSVLRHLGHVVNTFLGNSSAPLAIARFVEIDTIEVLQIDCRPAKKPVYLTGLTGDDIEFYIRRQSSSVKLKPYEEVAFLLQRFCEKR